MAIHNPVNIGASQERTTLLKRNKKKTKRPNLLQDALSAVDAALGTVNKENEALSDALELERQGSPAPKQIAQDKPNDAPLKKGSSMQQPPENQDRKQPQPLNGPNTPPTKAVRQQRLPSPPAGAPAGANAARPPQKTQRLRSKKEGAQTDFYSEPVVGWLVVVGGPGIGAYKPIFQGNNTIGRAQNQQIQINFGDETISAEEQAFIRYDADDKNFLLVPNLSKTNVVWVNDSKPTAAVELKHMDVIAMGRTSLVFVPFCGKEFDWGDLKKA